MKHNELRRMAIILAELHQIREDGRDLGRRLGIEDAADNLAALEEWILHQLPELKPDLVRQSIPGLCERLDKALEPVSDNVLSPLFL